MNTFSDILKRSFLESFEGGGITIQVMGITIVVTVVLSLYLFLVYLFMGRKSFYNMNFNLSLVGMAVVTAAIVLAIQSNLVLSLGMVGALSIVRYRSAVKEPLDLFFLFWSIAIGVMCGAQQYLLAIGVSLVLTILLYVLSTFPVLRVPYVLVVNAKRQDMEKIRECVSAHCQYFKVRSSYISEEGKLRMIIEMKTREQDELLQELSSHEGISASVLTYEGDIVG